VLHEGQRRVNGDPHSTQNFARSGFSAPHFEQRIATLPIEHYRATDVAYTAATQPAADVRRLGDRQLFGLFRINTMHLKPGESFDSSLTFICGVQIRLPSARVMNGCSKGAVAAAVYAGVQGTTSALRKT
jgi:hypothetical protein